MPSNKKDLAKYTATKVAEFLANGGVVTVCKPGVARG